jgi:transformation/transcription domain-associated protein
MLQLRVTRSQLRDLLVELCLTVPVRLSALLPYLHYLMRPLVLALRSSDELVSQGLRTLELCIDNLTPEFLDPVIEPVRQELMYALWSHMKPRSAATQHGEKTLRILGKLAGRNREELLNAPQLDPQDLDGPCLRLLLPFDQEAGIHLPVDDLLPVALDVMRLPQPSPAKALAFQFLQVCFASVFSLPVHEDLEVSLVCCLASRVPLPQSEQVPVMVEYHAEPRTKWHETVLKLLHEDSCVRVEPVEGQQSHHGQPHRASHRHGACHVATRGT